ncbi:angiopoietin-4 [Protopterus annectens]|uniref:angiopoietin-4 n=1 Tax=Protopterus annectens TaxID=7888 RepID=UPI001CFBD05B|nr:angiopoietin-4 [Protopterus annectens]
MWFVRLSFSLSLVTAVASAASGQRRVSDNARKRHRVHQGQCSYTFVLPELDHCRGGSDQYNGNALLRDSPQFLENEWSLQKLQHLENIMENNTLWMLKLENYIQENIKTEMAQIQQNAVQNHTAVMLEIGTNLLSQTAEQTRKLTDVEAQVMNQTSRIEIQLLENSLSTNKLEKQLILQTNEIQTLHSKNTFLENKVQEMESKHREQLEAIKAEKEKLRQLVDLQSSTIEELEKQLHSAINNNSLLQKQQLQLMEAVRSLQQILSQGKVKFEKEDKVFQDCSQIYRSGQYASGVYEIHINNVTEPRKVFCDMKLNGGGWTVIQRRSNGSVDFQKSWEDYKAGFGEVNGEYWLGNEAIYLLTSQLSYTLRIELRDWEGNQAYSQYETFQLGSERQHYKLFLSGYSGSAGQQNCLVMGDTNFSTRDRDNDNCICKCAQMLTGGWWFDACGLSNLNGVYYPAGHHLRKLNGIKWHYFRGPSYSLQQTTMMIRPSDF